MANNANIVTLRRLLTQSKPEVPCKTNAKKNTSGKWPEVIASNIRLWNEFNLNILNESYGHILDIEIPAGKLAGRPRAEAVLNDVEITKPIDTMHLIGWHDRILRPTLAFAKKHLQLHEGLTLEQYVSPDKKEFERNQPNLRIDHYVKLADYPVASLIVGLGLPSSKFQGRRLADRPEAASKDSLLPLRQLANLCDKASTRYGYIVTDQDLLVCCYYKTAVPGSTAAAANWKVALMPVPWTRYGEGQLTTDLALWWLCMLALSGPHHRKLVSEGEAIGIDQWYSHIDIEGGWVRRHLYSNREQPMDPQPPQAYQAPNSGNPAVFEAPGEINIDHNEFNIDPNFDLVGNFDLNSKFDLNF
ncbi:hypothetical protein Hte_007400 [Hypoxylon texense]